jgi:hypothetical protein
MYKVVRSRPTGAIRIAVPKPKRSNAPSRLPILALRVDPDLWATELEAGLQQENPAEKH